MGSPPSRHRSRQPVALARRLTVTLAAGFALIGVATAAPGANAQVPPPPEDNPLAPVSPTLSEVCGLANSAASLIPLAAGLFPGAEVPPELTQLLGPLTTVCAYVPPPATSRECAIDTDLYQALTPFATALTGQGLLLDPATAARVTDQIAAVEALIPVTGGGASALLDGIAKCSITAPTDPPAVPPVEPPVTAAPAVTPGSTVADPAPRRPALGPTPLNSPIASPEAPPSDSNDQAAPPVPVQLTSGPAVDHFRDRMILVTPLLLLGVGLALRSFGTPFWGVAGVRKRSRDDGRR